MIVPLAPTNVLKMFLEALRERHDDEDLEEYRTPYRWLA